MISCRCRLNDALFGGVSEAVRPKNGRDGFTTDTVKWHFSNIGFTTNTDSLTIDTVF